MNMNNILLTIILLISLAITGCSIGADASSEKRVVYSEPSIIELLNKVSEDFHHATIITTNEGHELILIEHPQHQYQINHIDYVDDQYVLINTTDRLKPPEGHGGTIGVELEDEEFQLELIPSDSAEHDLPRIKSDEFAINLTNENGESLIDNSFELK
ncbi:hypothetical protein [Alkalibacillus haloalkaliphilus]|uniref:Uncharacterized protein n=1 Tax=Alkalibacillus haloalkaliphilus TaxID=94136 RepID=A0A511W3N0_9BACI|nr:hypothetical protein [Alkalibacillus haloalkaliphilus]GEN45706.1 hypothetical protein AHA02nite_14820 [Alkalibacillus haloalkaliphilus]